MLNTGITSTISLRTRGSLVFSTNDYAHCSNVSRPSAYSSSKSCCSCCCNSIYTVPLSPSYGCSLYGFRQSSLIQWSPYRRLISGGCDYYSRLPACDVDVVCYCDEVCKVKERSVGRRRRGFKKCLVYEERSERCDIGGVDEAEVLLSLLTEDIGEECYLVRKETQRLVRKPLVERRENGGVCNECGSKKKRVDVGVSESDSRSEHGSVVSSRKNNNRRKEIIRREEEKEELLREDNRKSSLRREHKGALLKNKTDSEKDEREALLRKASQRTEEKRKQERESMLRKENWKVRLKTEEEQHLLRKEEHRQKLVKDGSSGSSYYSLSSNGDDVSDNEIDLTEGRFQEGSSSGHKRNSRNDEIVYQDTREEDQRRANYREDHAFGLTEKISSKELRTGSSVVESDFRKKSEKKLVDISVEEMESRQGTSLKESKSSMSHESNYEKSSDYNVSYDDTKVKLTQSTTHDEERKQQITQARDGVSESETMLKYKHFVGRQDSHSGDVRNSSGSQRVYTEKGEMSTKIASLNQETVGEHQHSTREDEYQRNSRKVSEVSKVQEIDYRKTSIVQQRLESSVRAEDYSTNIHSTINDAKKQQQQYDQVSGLVESRGNSQQISRKDGQSILKREATELKKQEENVNLASSSSLGPKEPHSLIPYRITKRAKSTNESDKLNRVLYTGVLRVEDRNKTESDTPVRPLPKLPKTGSMSLGQKFDIATDEDATGSASRLEESSAHYVGEFVEQVRNKISSSEIQREKETYETEVSHQDISGDSHSKDHDLGDHDLGNDSQQPGTKGGPSDEMWKVDELSVQELSKAEVQDDASKAGNAIVKRTGKSMWNIISDIVLLRWSSRSEGHSSDRKTGGRSSPNQSVSSVTWFSGHEAEENEEATEEKEGGIITQGSSGSHQVSKIRSQVEEISSSSTSEGHLRHEGINAPSSSVIQESGSAQVSISLPSGGEISEGNSGDTSLTAVVDSSIPLPALRLRRSPAVQGDKEAGEAHASNSSIREQLNTESLKQTGSAVNEGNTKQKKLQRKDHVVQDRFAEWEEAYRLEAEQRKVDEMFMREALLEAQKAADNWEVPVGAVLVHNGKIIGRGCNLVEELRDSTAHAEILCIREASNMLRTWRLSETTLYVTLEPCPMCAGAILQARVDTVVWGAPNKLLGADGSWIRLFPSGDGGNDAEPSDKPPAPVHPFHPKITIRRGVLSSECADAMQQFFKRRRKKDKKDETASTPPPSCLPISHRPSKLLAKMHDAFNLMLCL